MAMLPQPAPIADGKAVHAATDRPRLGLWARDLDQLRLIMHYADELAVDIGDVVMRTTAARAARNI